MLSNEFMQRGGGKKKTKDANLEPAIFSHNKTDGVQHSGKCFPPLFTNMAAKNNNQTLPTCYNKDVADVTVADESQKFSNEGMNTLLCLWVRFNPYTHSCFCDVFHYVSPGRGDSELLITLLSSLEQNYSTKRESSWLTMQLVIQTICQN